LRTLELDKKYGRAIIAMRNGGVVLKSQDSDRAVECISCPSKCFNRGKTQGIHCKISRRGVTKQNRETGLRPGEAGGYHIPEGELVVGKAASPTGENLKF
jgi:hypothetical protein